MPRPGTPARQRNKPFILTLPMDTILKQAVAAYHLLTSEQVTALLYRRGTLKTVKAYLKALTDAKYLQSVTLPTARGKRPHLYFLGLYGKKLLRDEGYDLPVPFEKADIQRRSPGWFMHTLELNTFLIQAATLEKSYPAIHLFDWQHDFTLQKNPVVSLTVEGKKIIVKPDGFLDFRYTRTIGGQQKTRRFCFLVELDRGTESERKFRKKLSDYLSCFERGAVQAHFGAKILTVLFPTTAGEHRVAKMRHLARLELKAHDATIGETSFRNQRLQFLAVPPLMQQPIDPTALFCTPLWLPPFGDTPTTLITVTA